VYSGNPSRNCSDFIGRQIPIPLLAEERWREAPAWSVRQNVSAGEHYYGFALSRSRFAPVCGFFGGFATFIDAAAIPSSARRGYI